MQNHKWRMFYVVFDLLESKHMKYVLDSGATTTVFEKVNQIMNAILQ